MPAETGNQIKPSEREAAAAEVRALFDRVAAGDIGTDARARVELCREYFFNPNFRRGLEDVVAAINGL